MTGAWFEYYAIDSDKPNEAGDQVLIYHKKSLESPHPTCFAVFAVGEVVDAFWRDAAS